MRKGKSVCRKGVGNILKIVLALGLAVAILISGGLNISKQLKSTAAVTEIVRFINMVKTELHYRSAEYDALYIKGKLQNYKYLSFFDGQIYADKSIGSDLSDEFNVFVKSIGTTDEAGQLTLCDEYRERFEGALRQGKLREKEKIQVNTALSIFGALTVLIFFL